MTNYQIMRFKDNKEYIIIDKIEHNKKIYLLILKSLELKDNLEDNFGVFEYNEQQNSLVQIKNIDEYNLVFSIFEARLDKQGEIIAISEKMHKMKIVRIDNYNYTLEDENGFRIIKNFNFKIDNNKPSVDDFVYMSKKIINENNIFEYGEIYNFSNIKEDEIIKLEGKDYECFLQRYYG